jgi:hypothetical protein
MLVSGVPFGEAVYRAGVSLSAAKRRRRTTAFKQLVQRCRANMQGR